MFTFDFRAHTMQETHDHIVHALRKQGVASVGPGDDLPGDLTCVYRAENGNMCAFGHVLPDEAYDPDMEGDSINPILRRLGCSDTISVEYRTYLREMQMAHDNCMPFPEPAKAGVNESRSLEAFEREAAKLARMYGLVHPPL